MLSPKTLKNNNFNCCLTSVKIFVQGRYLSVHGFPHTPQDGHTHSCAETTIWSILEYFSSKYSYYSPVLPSQIIQLLDKKMERRMLPSVGLDIYSISYAIKYFGFGTMIYSKKYQQEDQKDFQRLMYYYIESGIPIIVALSTKTLHHAVIYIGHMNKELPTRNLEVNDPIIETADFYDKYVVIDDNFPPYQSATFNQPGSYYKDPERKSYEITSFIVPLYPRIYLDASQARKLITTIMYHKEIGCVNRNPSKKIVLRFFLTSSNSFKMFIRNQKNTDKDFKNIQSMILHKTMPKFIWVAELTNMCLYKENLGNGLILIDATGDNSLSSILFVYYPENLLNIQCLTLEKHPSVQFLMYKNNLKGEWNKWQT